MKFIKNKKGFTVSMLCFGLPLFMGSLMIFTSLVFCIRNYELSHSICFKHTLQAQTQMKLSLVGLLSLNPIVNSLRIMQTNLETLYQTAIATTGPFTPYAVNLKLKIIKLKNKRKLLDKKQKKILNQSVEQVNYNFKLFKMEMRRFKTQYIKKDHLQPIPLAVNADQKNSIAPSYSLKSQFSNEQRLSFSWKMPIYQFLPNWLINFHFIKRLSLYKCAATLKKQGLSWKVRIINAKIPLLKGV